MSKLLLCHPSLKGAILLGTGEAGSVGHAMNILNMLGSVPGFSIAEDLVFNIPKSIGCYEHCPHPSEATIESCPEYELPEYETKPILNAK